MNEPIIRCPECSAPYRQMAHFCGDQSRCPACVRKLEQEMAEAMKPRPDIVEFYRNTWTRYHAGPEPVDVTARSMRLVQP